MFRSGPGNDDMFGQPGDDRLFGERGNDNLSGQDGDNGFADGGGGAADQCDAEEEVNCDV